jgi:predicted nucleic acid-binding protein
MASKRLRKLAVDANPILSALIKGKAHAILSRTDLEFFTTEFTVREVIEHIPEIVSRVRQRGVSIEKADLYLAFVVAPLEIRGREFYRDLMPAAKRRIEKRDPDDVDLLALALKLRIPIWTNDQDYSSCGVKCYTTAQLLKKLKIEE